MSKGVETFKLVKLTLGETYNSLRWYQKFIIWVYCKIDRF